MQKIINADKWQEHDLVFPNLVDNPIDPNNMIKDFRKLSEKAGLPKIRFHDIRHTFGRPFGRLVIALLNATR